jgi:hypothetical protein
LTHEKRHESCLLKAILKTQCDLDAPMPSEQMSFTLQSSFGTKDNYYHGKTNSILFPHLRATSHVNSRNEQEQKLFPQRRSSVVRERRCCFMEARWQTFAICTQLQVESRISTISVLLKDERRETILFSHEKSSISRTPANRSVNALPPDWIGFVGSFSRRISMSVSGIPDTLLFISSWAWRRRRVRASVLIMRIRWDLSDVIEADNRHSVEER